MNIAITATEPSLDAKIDPRFGRCPYFLIVDADTLNLEAVENPSITLGSGAGIQSAQFMAERNVKYVLTGNCGPNAYQTLAAAGISVIIGCSGTVSDAIEQFKAGHLNAADQPNVASKSGLAGASTATNRQEELQQPPATGGMGMGRGMGGGMGRGGGRGMGQGRGAGRGMGGGMGRGQGMGRGGGTGAGFAQGPVAMPQQSAPPINTDDELDMLKQQAETLGRQIQQIQQRIQQLEQEKE